MNCSYFQGLIASQYLQTYGESVHAFFAKHHIVAVLGDAVLRQIVDVPLRGHIGSAVVVWGEYLQNTSDQPQWTLTDTKQQPVYVVVLANRM